MDLTLNFSYHPEGTPLSDQQAVLDVTTAVNHGLRVMVENMLSPQAPIYSEVEVRRANTALWDDAFLDTPPEGQMAEVGQ